MKIRAALLALFLCLPVLASGALYQVKVGRLQSTEPDLTVDLRYPIVSGLGPAVDEAFNAQSRGHAHQMAAEFEKQARQALKESPEVPGGASLNINFVTKHLSDRLLAILVTGGEFMGGAHPNPVIYSLLVDPKTGRKVANADLFTANSKYLDALSKLSRAQLKPRLPELNTDTETMMTGTAPKAENFQVMWPTDKGLSILFSPYQVAPYSSGAPEIVIPYEKLGKLLSDRFFDN